MKNKLCLGLLAAASGAYLVRRLGLRWGATDAEVYRPLPGDEVEPHPMLETKHAIWPWLVQIGYQRAGWYTDSWYSWVDRYLFREKRPPSPDHLLPQFQHLEVGDAVLDGPPTYFTVAALEPEQALVLYSTTHGTALVPRFLRNIPKLLIYNHFSWSFILDEGDNYDFFYLMKGIAVTMTKIKEFISNERLQYQVYIGLSIGVVGLTAIGYFSNNLLFQRYLGRINPLIAILLIVFLGVILLSFLLSRGWFAIFKRENLKGLFRRSGLAALSVLISILVDLKVGFPADMNILFPESLLYYPAIGFAVEILFHILPLSVLLIGCRPESCVTRDSPKKRF